MLSVTVNVNEKVRHNNPEINDIFFFFRSFVTVRTCKIEKIKSLQSMSRMMLQSRSNRKRILNFVDQYGNINA